MLDNRLKADESPWIVRHNYSYIKSEHPDRPGNVSYGYDSSGSFALCVMARPFSNTSLTGKVYDKFEQLSLEPKDIDIGYKVFNDKGELLETESFLFTLELDRHIRSSSGVQNMGLSFASLLFIVYQMF